MKITRIMVIIEFYDIITNAHALHDSPFRLQSRIEFQKKKKKHRREKKLVHNSKSNKL